MSNTVVLINEKAPQNPWRLTFRQFQRHRLANLSLILLIVFVLLAIFADRIAPFNPNDIDPRASGVTRGFPQPPTLEHPLGTDDLNRDLSARLLYGMRVSLAVGFLAMFISIGLGVSELVAPGAIARISGAANRKSVVRICGVREVVAGTGFLNSPRPTKWLWWRVAGDVMDAAAIVGGAQRDQRKETVNALQPSPV